MVRPAFRETTSLGAALAAGLAVNMWTREEVFAAAPQPTTRHVPVLPHAASGLVNAGSGLANAASGGMMAHAASAPAHMLAPDGPAAEPHAAAATAVAAAAFLPAITPAAASRRYDRWRKAVERALDLADLAPQPGEDEPVEADGIAKQ